MPDALISEPYMKLNADLHRTRADYGRGGSRWGAAVLAMAREYNCHSVLDYGCGKGRLAEAIGGDLDVCEYDPAIAGKDAPPKCADLVVCTDVLEHVEPDHLEAVLEHISDLSRKGCLISISTRPAGKTLADGRNAHLLVQPASWWTGKLWRWFNIDASSASKYEVTYHCTSRLRELEQLKTTPAISDEVRNEYVRINIAKTQARLQDAPAHDRRAVIVCFGPSLSLTWPAVAAAKNTGADVVTTSGAHRFMVDRGVVPYAHVDCDPRPNGEHLEPLNDHVRYWLSSCVKPEFVDRVIGHNLSLWHLHNGSASEILMDEMEPGSWMLMGGGNVGLRTMCLLYTMGYRHIDIHGMDSSFSDDAQYAGAHHGKRHNEMRVRCGDRWFATSPILVDYARQFPTTLAMLSGANVRLHGDGLLQHMQRMAGAHAV